MGTYTPCVWASGVAWEHLGGDPLSEARTEDVECKVVSPTTLSLLATNYRNT